jgi:hypothetical protein
MARYVYSSSGGVFAGMAVSYPVRYKRAKLASRIPSLECLPR